MIEAPLKFVQVEREILLADVVVGADDSAFSNARNESSSECEFRSNILGIPMDTL